MSVSTIGTPRPEPGRLLAALWTVEPARSRGRHQRTLLPWKSPAVPQVERRRYPLWFVMDLVLQPAVTS